VTRDAIGPIIAEISTRMAASGRASAAPRYAVDGAKYIATIAAELSEAEQARLFEAIGGKGGLIEGVREHYVPFAMVASLPKELVLEIFGERPDAQIAQAVFDSKPEVRTAVVNAFPDIRAESIKDELRVLDADQFYDKRNRRLSLQLQKEISRFLLKLYSEGLLSFNRATDSSSDEPRQNNGNAA
jgi:flagellar motor switch protein FliG